MGDLEEALDRMMMCVDAMEREKEEVLGLILSGQQFEAGMMWNDFNQSLEALKIEIAEARDLT